MAKTTSKTNSKEKPGDKSDKQMEVTLKGWADPKLVNAILKENAGIADEKKRKAVPGNPKLRSFERDGFITFAGTAFVPPGTMVQLLSGETYEVEKDKGHYAQVSLRLRALKADKAFSIKEVFAATVPVEAYEKREQLYPRKEQAYFGLCAKAEMVPLPLLDKEGKVVKSIVKMSTDEQAAAVEARLKLIQKIAAEYSNDPAKMKFLGALKLLVDSERSRAESLRSGMPAISQKEIALTQKAQESSRTPAAPKITKVTRPKAPEKAPEAPAVSVSTPAAAPAPEAPAAPAAVAPEFDGSFISGRRWNEVKNMSVERKAAMMDEFASFMELVSVEAKKLILVQGKPLVEVVVETNIVELYEKATSGAFNLGAQMVPAVHPEFRAEAIGFRLRGVDQKIFEYRILGQPVQSPVEEA